MATSTVPVSWLTDLKRRHTLDSSGFYDFGLIVYGSLLHEEEIRSVFRHPPENTAPVKIQGFSRVFNKWVSERLRKPQGDQAAVLNLRAEDRWFNGLLIPRVSPSGLEKYASREREYELTEIPPERLDFYPGYSKQSIPMKDKVYTCLLERGDTIRDDIKPIPSYVDLCLDGARQQGDDFYRDFMNTTWTGKQTLRSYLNGTLS